jgi:hypothetical protein
VSDPNPYSPPTADGAPPSASAVAPGASHKLYSVKAVVLATFLGSFLGGGALLALNLKRSGMVAAAWVMLVGATAATAATAWLGSSTSFRPTIVFLAVQLVIMGLLAQALMTRRLHAHAEAGGELASMGSAAGIGFGAMGVLVAVVLGVAIVQQLLVKKVEAGNAEVYYGDGVSEAQARRAAEFFADERRFGRSKSRDRIAIRVTRDGKGSAVCFVVQEGAWKDDEVMEACRDMMKDSDPAVFPRPISVSTTWTGRSENRFHSRTHCDLRLAGTSSRPLRTSPWCQSTWQAAIAWIVLPRPMSSARSSRPCSSSRLTPSTW